MTKNRVVLLGVLFLAGVLAVLIWSSMNLQQHRVEVCITFNDQQNCRTASGDTREHALRTAIDNACATISSGVTETIACGKTTPDAIKWLAVR